MHKELKYKEIQVSQVRELIEVKEVITPYGRSGSEETIVILRKTKDICPLTSL